MALDGELRGQLAGESVDQASTWRPGADQGDYVYTAGAGLNSFTLVGLGGGGAPIFSVP